MELTSGELKFHFLIGKIGIVTFLNSLAEAKRIHMNYETSTLHEHYQA